MLCTTTPAFLPATTDPLSLKAPLLYLLKFHSYNVVFLFEGAKLRQKHYSTNSIDKNETLNNVKRPVPSAKKWKELCVFDF